MALIKPQFKLMEFRPKFDYVSVLSGSNENEHGAQLVLMISISRHRLNTFCSLHVQVRRTCSSNLIRHGYPAQCLRQRMREPIL